MVRDAAVCLRIVLRRLQALLRAPLDAICGCLLSCYRTAITVALFALLPESAISKGDIFDWHLEARTCYNDQQTLAHLRRELLYFVAGHLVQIMEQLGTGRRSD